MSNIIHAGTPRRQPRSAVHVRVPSPSANDRWNILDKVKALRALFKLNDRDITVLQAHLSVLPKGPIRLDGLNMSYMKVQDILERANGMNEKAFRRSEVRLEKLGLIHRKISANGRRFPIYRNHKVVDAYGIDLAPLITRSDEFDDLLEELECKQQECRELRTKISCALQSHRRTLTEIGSAAIEALDKFISEIRNALRRKSTDIAQLENIFERVAVFGVNLIDKRAAETPVVSDSQPDKNNADDGQYVRHIKSQRKETQIKRQSQIPFCKYRMGSLWKKAPTLSEYFPNIPTNERNLTEILFRFSSFLGLKKETTIKAITALGFEKLAYCLHYLTPKFETIQKPNRYLISMLRSYEAGQSIAGGRIRMGEDIFSGTPV